MKRAIVAHLRDFVAMLGLLVVAIAIAVYILDQQRFRFPFVEPQPKRLAVELRNAQAVQPGQGQTVRVAGVEVGKIGKVRLDQGVALVELEIEEEYRNLIREDATALLRPKTPLKDMFLEVSPGGGRVLGEGGRIRLENTAPDVDPDEIYEALDADTRPYLKLLVSGAGKGLAGRGEDLNRTLRRLEPLHRDLARVTRATSNRRRALKRLIHNYGELVDELGSQPQDLTRLVTASHQVFDALAQEEQNVSASVRRLPGALRRTERTFGKVQDLSRVLRPALQSLREPLRRLDETNAAVRPFLERTTPVLRNRIRPFVRAARPFTDDLRVAAREGARATPELSGAVSGLNRFFNMGAYNPGGAEGLDGKPLDQQRSRQEGFLYWLAWTAQNGVSLFNTADAQGPWRRLTICGIPPALLTGILQDLLAQLGAENPQAVTELLQDDGPIEDLLRTQFGICDFNQLPTEPLPDLPPLPIPPLP